MIDSIHTSRNIEPTTVTAVDFDRPITPVKSAVSPRTSSLYSTSEIKDVGTSDHLPAITPLPATDALVPVNINATLLQKGKLFSQTLFQPVLPEAHFWFNSLFRRIGHADGATLHKLLDIHKATFSQLINETAQKMHLTDGLSKKDQIVFKGLTKLIHESYVHFAQTYMHMNLLMKQRSFLLEVVLRKAGLALKLDGMLKATAPYTYYYADNHHPLDNNLLKDDLVIRHIYHLLQGSPAGLAVAHGSVYTTKATSSKLIKNEQIKNLQTFIEAVQHTHQGSEASEQLLRLVADRMQPDELTMEKNYSFRGHRLSWPNQEKRDGLYKEFSISDYQFRYERINDKSSLLSHAISHFRTNAMQLFQSTMQTAMSDYMKGIEAGTVNPEQDAYQASTGQQLRSLNEQLLAEVETFFAIPAPLIPIFNAIDDDLIAEKMRAPAGQFDKEDLKDSTLSSGGAKFFGQQADSFRKLLAETNKVLSKSDLERLSEQNIKADAANPPRLHENLVLRLAKHEVYSDDYKVYDQPELNNLVQDILGIPKETINSHIQNNKILTSNILNLLMKFSWLIQYDAPSNKRVQEATLINEAVKKVFDTALSTADTKSTTALLNEIENGLKQTYSIFQRYPIRHTPVKSMRDKLKESYLENYYGISFSQYWPSPFSEEALKRLGLPDEAALFTSDSQKNTPNSETAVGFVKTNNYSSLDRLLSQENAEFYKKLPEYQHAFFLKQAHATYDHFRKQLNSIIAVENKRKNKSAIGRWLRKDAEKLPASTLSAAPVPKNKPPVYQPPQIDEASDDEMSINIDAAKKKQPLQIKYEPETQPASSISNDANHEQNRVSTAISNQPEHIEQNVSNRSSQYSNSDLSEAQRQSKLLFEEPHSAQSYEDLIADQLKDETVEETGAIDNASTRTLWSKQISPKQSQDLRANRGSNRIINVEPTVSASSRASVLPENTSKGGANLKKINVFAKLQSFKSAIASFMNSIARNLNTALSFFTLFDSQPTTDTSNYSRPEQQPLLPKKDSNKTKWTLTELSSVQHQEKSFSEDVFEELNKLGLFNEQPKDIN